MNDTALRLADALERDYHDETLAPRKAAAELRRLVAENEALRGELAEQARVNGMGGEREARLMAELERKSDAIQRLWKERDELRTLNAELVEALRWYVDTDEVLEMEGNEFWLDGRERARAALAKAGESNG